MDDDDAMKIEMRDAFNSIHEGFGDDVPEDQADFAMIVGDFNSSEKQAFSEMIKNYIDIE